MTDKKVKSRVDKAEASVNVERRQMLLRTGVLGAVVAFAPGLLLREARAMHSGEVAWTMENLTRALNALRDDTFSGVTAFAVPGNDNWSVAQGRTTPVPGGMTTRADLYLSGGVDRLVPLPVPFMQQLLNAVGAELAQTPLQIPDSFQTSLGVPEEWLLEHLDAELDNFLTTGVSNSVFCALLLNLVATRVNANTLSGTLLSPFSRLTWEQKAEVFRQLEAESSFVKEAIRLRMTNSAYRAATPGVLHQFAAFMLRIPGFGSYCEFAVFDAATKTLRARPLGWAISNYQPGAPTTVPVAEGWDEFKGYYQNRRSV